MKYLIASDIHGSAYYCRLLMEQAETERADAILLLGDLLYHGPRNALPRDYDPKTVITMLNEWKNTLFCVRGNCDSEVDQMVLEFPIMAEYAIFSAGSHLMFATHGHIYNTYQLPPLPEQAILLHGHTHIPAWEPFGCGQYYLNPGSVSLPKEKTPHSYMTWNEQTFTWKDVTTGKAFHSLTLP